MVIREERHVPTRRGVDMGAAGEVARSATAPAATSVQMIFMGRHYSLCPPAVVK